MIELSQSTNGSIDAFSEAARRYSAAQSRENGGSLGFRPLSSLPPQLQSVILPLPPGGVTEPIPLGQAIAIFQLREFREEGFMSPRCFCGRICHCALCGWPERGGAVTGRSAARCG